MNQPIGEGIRLFNEGAWFEAHEVFEDLWLGATAGEKGLFKGLVQTCATLIQHSRGETAGALRLLERSLSHLEGVGTSPLPGFDLPRLVADLHRVRSAMKGGKTFPLPVIEPTGHL